jgi:hypothetical protein
MVDKIMKVNNDSYMIIFDHKSPVLVSSEDGLALTLVESLLSPRADMSYSEYVGLTISLLEDTQICNLKDVA